MTKAEILSQIKKAEEDARSIILQANDAKASAVLEAKGQSRGLVDKSVKEAADASDKKIAEAKKQIKLEKDKLLKEGLAGAEAIKSETANNIPKATEYLLEQFERTIHA